MTLTVSGPKKVPRNDELTYEVEKMLHAKRKFTKVSVASAPKNFPGRAPASITSV